jgi:hypothetical protein
MKYLEMSGQLQAPAVLNQGKEPASTDLIGVWVGPEGSLDVVAERGIPAGNRTLTV